MGEDRILELKTRRMIYQYIRKYPGLHKRELERLTQVAYSTLDYHLHYLIRRNLISTEEDPRFTRYYATGEVGTQEKKMINMLRQAVPRDIILFLLLNPHSSQESIRDHLQLAPSTTSYHLKRLSSLGMIASVTEQKESFYDVIDPDRMIDLIITYKHVFLSNTVDQFVRTIVDIHPRYLRKNDEKNK